MIVSHHVVSNRVPLLPGHRFSSADVSGSLPPFSLPPSTCCLLVLQPTAYGQHSAKQKTPVCRGTWRDGQPTELTREPGSLNDPLARRIARWSQRTVIYRVVVGYYRDDECGYRLSEYTRKGYRSGPEQVRSPKEIANCIPPTLMS
jgi:hypothetical protein